MKKLFFLFILTALVVFFIQSYKNNPKLNIASLVFPTPAPQTQRVVYEESVITDVVAKSLPSVVTIGMIKTQQQPGTIEMDPFNFFNFRTVPGQQQKIDQNIGSGFIVSSDGLIITNKHVVSDTEASYKVLTNDNKKYTVEKIYRDSLNDLAILKIQATGLKPLELGDSSHLKLGQMTIAIGTPLGEFVNTVTKGIVSGLGRGITAGSPFEGYVEKLDGVIQTDAAINPGNSGGPLLNSRGQVIGVNSAIAQGGQNIGFALPVNSVKDLLKTFRQGGSTFDRPYLGVQYKMVDRNTAIMNEIPEGAYVQSVGVYSPAFKGGIKEGDIITSFAGTKVSSTSKTDLSQLIAQKKVGDVVDVVIWRNGEVIKLTVTITAVSQ